MKHYILFLMVTVFYTSLYCQPLHVQFQPDIDHSGKIIWTLKGKTTLPKGTHLYAFIKFEENLIPRTTVYRIVTSSDILFTFGPFNHQLPSGEYSVEVHTRFTTMEGMPYKHNLFHGRRALQYKERKQEENEYYQLLKLMASTIKEWQEKSQDLMQDKKKNINIIRTECLQIVQNYTNMQKEWYKNTNVICHYPDLRTYSNQYCNTVLHYFKFLLVDVFHVHKIPIPQSYLEIPSQQKERMELIQRYERQMQNIVNLIKKNMPSPQKLTFIELEKDIVWGNEIYRQMIESYKKHNENFQKEKLDEEHAIFIEELATLQTRVEEYKESPLWKKYSKEFARFPIILTLLNQVRENHLSLLYQKNRVAINKKVTSSLNSLAEELRVNFLILLEIPSQEKQKLQKEQEKQEKLIQSIFDNALQLHTNLQQGLKIKTMKDFNQWTSKWEQDKKNLFTDCYNITESKKQYRIRRAVRNLCNSMNQRIEIYQDTLSNQNQKNKLLMQVKMRQADRKVKKYLQELIKIQESI